MSEQEGKIFFERSLICSGFRLYNETESDAYIISFILSEVVKLYFIQDVHLKVSHIRSKSSST